MKILMIYIYVETLKVAKIVISFKRVYRVRGGGGQWSQFFLKMLIMMHSICIQGC